MEISDIKKIIEALLFVSDKPLLNREIKAVIKEDLPENVKLEDIMQELQQEYVQLNRAFELKFVADGWTFATRPEYSTWIKKLLKEKTILKLSPSAMEVLAIIAYKQPITRAEIDNIRGVDSGGVIDTLTDRKFVKIVDRKETLGRPLLYGTTQEFLRHFGLSHLSELPVIDVAKDVLPQQQETVQELPFDNSENVSENSSQNDEQTNILQPEPAANRMEDVKIVGLTTENVKQEQNDSDVKSLQENIELQQVVVEPNSSVGNVNEQNNTEN